MLSSGDICRFCHITHKELTTKIHDFTEQGANACWTIEEYDNIAIGIEQQDPQEEEDCQVVTDENLFTEIAEPVNLGDEVEAMDVDSQEVEEEDFNEEEGILEENNSNQYGLRGECPLNVLQSFHCVTGMPPDSLHDVLEGELIRKYFEIRGT